MHLKEMTKTRLRVPTSVFDLQIFRYIVQCIINIDEVVKMVVASNFPLEPVCLWGLQKIPGIIPHLHIDGKKAYKFMKSVLKLTGQEKHLTGRQKHLTERQKHLTGRQKHLTGR